MNDKYVSQARNIGGVIEANLVDRKKPEYPSVILLGEIPNHKGVFIEYYPNSKVGQYEIDIALVDTLACKKFNLSNYTLNMFLEADEPKKRVFCGMMDILKETEFAKNLGPSTGANIREELTRRNDEYWIKNKTTNVHGMDFPHRANAILWDPKCNREDLKIVKSY